MFLHWLASAHSGYDLDIGFLYEIVARAEQNPDVSRLPCRALFGAHDEVVKEHGVEAGSQICNLLFKIGARGLKGESLLDRFNNILREMGIIVELVDYENDDKFDADGVGGRGDSAFHGSGEARVPVNGSYGRNDANPTPAEDESTTHHLPRRRASFNSTYDIGDDLTERSLANRPSSRSSMSRLQVGKTNELPSLEAKPEMPSAAVASYSHEAQLGIQFFDFLRLMNRPGSSKRQKYGEHAHGPFPNGHLQADEQERHKLFLASLAHRDRSSYSFPSSEESEGSPIVEGSDGEGGIEEREPLFEASLVMLRDADISEMLVRPTRRRFLIHWWKKTVQSNQSRRNIETDAVAHGKRRLRRLILDRIRKGAQENSDHLKEIVRGRDEFLMSRAFDNWREVARDGVSKTSAARRHVIVSRCFAAWQDMTLRNEANVQHFLLQRRLVSWRRKTDWIKTCEADAAACYNWKLLLATFEKLLSHSRASRTCRHSRKKRSFVRWLRGLRENNDQIKDADNRYKHKILQNLGRKSLPIVSERKRADASYRERLLKMILEEWRAQSRLAPSARNISTKIDMRILETTYNRWRQRSRQLEEAVQLDLQKITRSAWTTWGDQLRCQIVNARIEERLGSEAMYKWIIETRFRILQQDKDKKLIGDMFPKFIENIHRTWSDLRRLADNYGKRRDKDMLRSKLYCWRNKASEQRQKEDEASHICASNLEREALAFWRDKRQNVVKLESRAQLARFYFLATRTQKQLHAKRIEATKKRYREFRKDVKNKLLAKFGGIWLKESRRVMDMEQEAIDFHRDKSLKIASTVFRRWREETIGQAQLTREADGYYHLRVAYRLLRYWAERFNQIRNMQDHSNKLYHDRVSRQAGTQLRRLSLRIFQVNSGIETANSLRERNSKKNSRSIIRLWVEKTMAAIAAHDSPGPALSSAASLDLAVAEEVSLSSIPPYLFETPSRFSDLLPMPPSSRGRASSLVTPNHQTSPLKRAGGTKELAHISTTPSTPLYTPFAGRVLRVEAGTPRTEASSQQRRRVRKSPAGANVRFVEDEVPESPTEGRSRRASRSM